MNPAEAGLHCQGGPLRREERGIKCYILKGLFPLLHSTSHAQCPFPSRTSGSYCWPSNFIFFIRNHPFLGAFHSKGHVLTSRGSSAPGTGWLTKPSQEHRNAVNHQYNHNQAGSGTRCHLDSAAKGHLQTNLTFSRASPAPKERHPLWERAAQSHAPLGQCCLSPSLPCLSTAFSKATTQTKALPGTVAPHLRYH